MLLVLATVLLLSSEVNSRVCNSETKVLTTLYGSLSSPAGGQYGTCTWSIVVPKNLRIIFYFKEYNIKSCGYACSGCTRIELKDNQSGPAWETFCDYKREVPEPVSTNTSADTSTLHINFILDNDDTESWFTAEYVTWPIEGKIDLTGNSNAEITSPNFPGKYPRNSNYTWSVAAPSGYRIKFEFTKFDLFHCADCWCDYLMIRDGPSRQSKLLDKFCSSGVGIVYASGNHVWMEFVSDLEQKRSDNIGFKATVSKEVKLYVIVLPCVFGILLVTIAVAFIVLTRRNRRQSVPRNGGPVAQMSLLNDDTQLSDPGPHNEASAPVYRPTTRAIKKP